MKSGAHLAIAAFLHTFTGLSSCSDPTLLNSSQPSKMPKFDTPENAFDSLFTAYKASDLDAMMFAKNFELDSRLFWQDLGLPVSTEQKEKSTSALETNFRNQMIDEGIPDYSDATYTINNIEERGEDTVVLSINLRWPSGETADLSIPAVFHDNQWWVVLAPGFDHL